MDEDRIKILNKYRRFACRSLSVVFHLVDSRHGLVAEDVRIMSECASFFGPGGKCKAKYVVVLTKADKNDKGVKGCVLEDVRATMREAGVAGSPIIQTSSETRMGRGDIWRFLRLAAERYDK